MKLDKSKTLISIFGLASCLEILALYLALFIVFDISRFSQIGHYIFIRIALFVGLVLITTFIFIVPRYLKLKNAGIFKQFKGQDYTNLKEILHDISIIKWSIINPIIFTIIAIIFWVFKGVLL